MSLTARDAERLGECVAGGGVAVFPTDTVYGVCCDPDSEAAAQCLYELKGRPASRASAVMFFTGDAAREELQEDLGEAERAALNALLPGPITALLPNRRQRFGPACRTDPRTLGLRVPSLPPPLQALQALSIPVLQSSANLSGGEDARTLEEIPRELLDGVDLVLDGGKLPGTPSTVVDLRDLQAHGRWRVLREGALAQADVAAAMGADGWH
jgi:L-threonylcarbamoyladenylate synthase